MENPVVTNFTSTETDLDYVFDVRMKHGCPLFQVHPFDSFAHLGEVIAQSNGFEDYSPCAQTCLEMMNRFLVKIQEVSSKKYIIATKLNPQHDYLSKDEPLEGWDESMIMKMYLSEMEPLKKDNILKWDVVATLSVKPSIDLRNLPINQPVII